MVSIDIDFSPPPWCYHQYLLSVQNYFITMYILILYLTAGACVAVGRSLKKVPPTCHLRLTRLAWISNKILEFQTDTDQTGERSKSGIEVAYSGFFQRSEEPPHDDLSSGKNGTRLDHQHACNPVGHSHRDTGGPLVMYPLYQAVTHHRKSHATTLLANAVSEAS